MGRHAYSARALGRLRFVLVQTRTPLYVRVSRSPGTVPTAARVPLAVCTVLVAERARPVVPLPLAVHDPVPGSTHRQPADVQKLFVGSFLTTASTRRLVQIRAHFVQP
jgi:hypothetical protein